MKKQPIRVNERIFEKHVFDRFGIRMFKREAVQIGGNHWSKFQYFPHKPIPPWLDVFQSDREYRKQWGDVMGFRIVRNKK